MARLRSRKSPVEEFAAEVESRLTRSDGVAVTNDDRALLDLTAADPGWVPLGRLLVERADVSDEQITSALATQSATGRRLGEILLSEGVISEQSLAGGLAAQFGLGTVELPRTKLERETIDLLSAEDARRLCAIGIRRDDDRVEFAVGDPVIEDLKKNLIAHAHAPVRLLIATKTEILEAIERAYSDTGEIGDVLRDFEERFADRHRAGEGSQQVAVDENAPVVRVVNLILERAMRDRASDVHIDPRADRVRIRVRTDGALHEVMSLPASMAVSLVSRIKVMADMNIVERRRPQDGKLEVTVNGRDLDVRVATAATVYGEKCVLRLLDKTRAFLGLSELGMADDQMDVYESLIRSPYGMVMCAGPTGSGKTTTLYATLAAIDNDELNVVTIEDPVEYVFPNINQIQINEQAGISFANGLRSVLRLDPDSILIGEIRDVDTARIAVQAALTGHFVMSSLHATDATSALHRFMDMGIEPFLIASSLMGVVGQRLVRKICPHCVEPYMPTVDELSFYERAGGKAKEKFVRGSGCLVCGYTGYYERIGVYEVLRVTDAIKELVVSNGSLSDLRTTAAVEGMRTLADEAIALVEQDQTTIAEVLRTVYVL
jgi:type IV pilus assembly protein PilB